MVAVHVVERRIQQADDVLQIVVWQVAARQDQVDLAHPLADIRAVEHRLHLVADG